MVEAPITAADFEPVTEENLKTVRVLIQSIFPVSYSDKFYQECLHNELVKVIIRRGEAIAIVAVKPETLEAAGQVLYIRSFGVHSRYRQSGIGSLLMSFIEAKCHALNLCTAMLHVQTSNKTAIRFYENRGFVTESLMPKYYHRCDPPDAYVMKKRFCDDDDNKKTTRV